MPEQIAPTSQLPPDDLDRQLTISQGEDTALVHIGVVGDTYTLLVQGKETAGRFCVIDMHVPPGGGPGPHRHDFEETFVILEGEVAVTFRGHTQQVKAGTTVNVPANAPHCFRNNSAQNARLLCLCSPAGIDEFFQQIGVPVGSRTAYPPKLDEAQMQQFVAKARSLGPKYRTELLKEA